jgi:5-methyltetrahydrofolate--homocysteine methyltransferase
MSDDYQKLMLQILSDRLVEALSEYLHYKIRTEWWGYSPEELFDPEKFLKGQFQGIRPAIGYASCPDHSEKKALFNLLEAEKNIGINLTENYAMNPASSVCGFYLSSPQAKYFSTNKIQPDQLNDYSTRKKSEVKFIEKFLSGQN